MGNIPDRYHYRCDKNNCYMQGFADTKQGREWRTLDHELDSGHDKWTFADAPADWMRENANWKR